MTECQRNPIDRVIAPSLRLLVVAAAMAVSVASATERTPSLLVPASDLDLIQAADNVLTTFAPLLDVRLPTMDEPPSVLDRRQVGVGREVPGP